MAEQKHKVIIRRCEAYETGRIARIVAEGMAELEAVPRGKVLLKPNVVIAHPEIFPHAFTRPEFLEGVLMAARQMAQGLEELAVGERSGITIPTRWCFRQAGYPAVLRRQRAKAYYFDESRHVKLPLAHGDNLRPEAYFPEPIAATDFLINLPKFKAHPWSRMTLALKNYIGIQDDRHRLLDHNSFLEHKIADLQEAVKPGFIAIDGITAGQKTMLTPTPYDLGVIVMGTNPCATDTVCAHMVHCDPRDIVHLRLAAERGIGPIDLNDIEISGDISLGEIQAKTKDFGFLMERVDDFFNDKSNIRCTVGRFPESHSPDYCWGGCPGALQEAMHIFRAFDSEVDGKMRKIRYVVGKVDGPLDLEPGERVFFAGACTGWQGEINGKPVKIEPTYSPSTLRTAEQTSTNDLLYKTMATLGRCIRGGRDYVHLPACTLSVADHVHAVSYLAGIRNVNFDPRMAVGVNVDYWRMRAGRALNRLR